MSPTYAKKSRRHYRYYTSAPLVRGKTDGKGIRLPAPDLEQLVVSSIADHLVDQQWLAQLAGKADLAQLNMVISAAEQWSKSVKSAPEMAMPPFLARVEIGETSVGLSIDSQALADAIGLTLTDDIATPEIELIKIVVPTKALRCGRQVRLAIGEVTSKKRSPDAQLVQLVCDGHRWFEDLRTGRESTIASLAKRDQQQVSHVSRNLSLAFLAPDIVEMILVGKQPLTLTPERLKAARPLPPDWDLRRAILLN